MTDPWGRFSEGAGRDLRALGFEDSLDVYEPTETYTPGEGYSVTYPGSPARTVDAEIVPPEVLADRNRGGTTSEADAIIRVAEPRSQWVGFGSEGEASVEVVDTETGVRYQVETVASERNGLTRLEASEL
jgi:hypothetical protein